MSAGLEITSKQPVPSTSGTQITTITIGRAFARADSSSFGSEFPITLPPVPVLPGGSVPPPALDPGTGTVTTPTTGLEGGVPPVTTAPQSASIAPPGTRLVGLVDGVRPRLSFYPILVLAGLVVLATSFGVRRTTRVSV